MKLISFRNIDKLWFFGLKESFILIIVLASLQEEDEIVTLKWSLRKATATPRRVPEICILNNKFLRPHMRFTFSLFLSFRIGNIYQQKAFAS